MDIGIGNWNSEKDCKDCHKTINQNHKNSAHANSWRDPIFQIAFQKEPRQWCMNCHAPLHKYPKNSDFIEISKSYDNTSIWTEGVNCSVCHVRNNEIFGKRNRNDIKEHRVIKDEVFSKNTLCNNCHQFNFPKYHIPSLVYTDVIMQGTGLESKEQFSFFEKSELCVSCHLKNNHHLNGTVFDTGWVYDWNVKVKTIADGNNFIVKLSMEYPKMGHMFPTGDLFRSLVFRIYDRNRISIFEYRFEKKMRLIDLHQVRDTRLEPFTNSNFTQSFAVKQKPIECELVYHLQFPIENELKGHLGESALKRQIFRDKCSPKSQ